MIKLDVCGEEAHDWHEIRSKTTHLHGNWHIFKGCKHCPMLLETIVSHIVTPGGNVVPKAVTYVISPDTKVELPVTVSAHSMSVTEAV